MSEAKLFSLKPEFVLTKNLLLNALAWLPISIAGGVESALIYVANSKENFPELLTFFFVPTVLIFVFLMVLGFLNEKLNYLATEYSIYSNRVEFSEGFINSDITNVMLVDVKEIHLKRSFLQRKWNLGTIRLVTNANANRPFSANIYSTGTNIRDIKNSVEVYEQLKKLVAAKK